MRGVAIKAGIAAGVIVLGFIAAILLLNATLYSPAGFVRGYVETLERGDSAGALELAGPPRSSSSLDDLLTREGMSEIESFEVVEREERDGVHRVSVRYQADGHTGSTEFSVRQTGLILGLFRQWEFASSPLAEIELTVLHTREFTANGVRLVAPVQDQPTTYLAFTPGVVTFAHRSGLLEAEPRTVVLGPPERTEVVELDAQANEAFVGQVQAEVDRYLDECASQPVLFPTGCPFGQQIADRIVDAPVWSIAEYPPIELRPTATPGEWLAPEASGVARLAVDVQSIYDGSITRFEADVPFSLEFVITFVGPSEIVITPRVD